MYCIIALMGLYSLMLLSRIVDHTLAHAMPFLIVLVALEFVKRSGLSLSFLFFKGLCFPPFAYMILQPSSTWDLRPYPAPPIPIGVFSGCLCLRSLLGEPGVLLHSLLHPRRLAGNLLNHLMACLSASFAFASARLGTGTGPTSIFYAKVITLLVTMREAISRNASCQNQTCKGQRQNQLRAMSPTLV